MAPQLMAMKGPSLRRLPRCSARAMSSLPVPLSPVTSTVASVSATWFTRSNRSCMGPLLP
jgi:hypothetical protein